MANYSKINYINPQELKPYDRNSKTHPEKQIKKLVKLIENYGFPESKAILVDEDLTIIAGHGRRLASLEANLKEVPYQIVTDISEADKKAMRIADNAIAESDWDYEMLKLEFQDLEFEDFDLDLMALDDVHFEAMENFVTFDENEDGDNNKENIIESNDTTNSFEHKCPKCSFTWSS